MPKPETLFDYDEIPFFFMRVFLFCRTDWIKEKIVIFCLVILKFTIENEKLLWLWSRQNISSNSFTNQTVDRGHIGRIGKDDIYLIRIVVNKL